MWDTLSQGSIFVLGALSVFLIARKNKWGFVLGLLSQPFWYVTAYLHEQWGIFLVSFVYTASWAYGIYEWFFREGKKKG